MLPSAVLVISLALCSLSLALMLCMYFRKFSVFGITYRAALRACIIIMVIVIVLTVSALGMRLVKHTKHGDNGWHLEHTAAIVDSFVIGSR